MSSNLIYRKIKEKANKQKRSFKKTFLFFFFLFVLFILSFLLIKRMGVYVLLIHVIILVIAFIIGKPLISEYSLVRLNNTEIISAHLIKISAHIDEYLKEPKLRGGELYLAKNKSLNILNQKIDQSLFIYKDSATLESNTKEFLIKLERYLNSDVKKALTEGTEIKDMIVLKDRLKILAEKIYKNDIGSAMGILKYAHLEEPSLGSKIINFILNTSYASYFLTFIILVGVLSFVINRLNLFSNLEGMNLLVSILLLIVSFSIFNKTKAGIQRILDFILSLLVNQNMKE